MSLVDHGSEHVADPARTGQVAVDELVEGFASDLRQRVPAFDLVGSTLGVGEVEVLLVDEVVGGVLRREPAIHDRRPAVGPVNVMQLLQTVRIDRDHPVHVGARGLFVELGHHLGDRRESRARA